MKYKNYKFKGNVSKINQNNQLICKSFYSFVKLRSLSNQQFYPKISKKNENNRFITTTIEKKQNSIEQYVKQNSVFKKISDEINFLKNKNRIINNKRQRNYLIGVKMEVIPKVLQKKKIFSLKKKKQLDHQFFNQIKLKTNNKEDSQQINQFNSNLDFIFPLKYQNKHQRNISKNIFTHKLFFKQINITQAYVMKNIDIKAKSAIILNNNSFVFKLNPNKQLEIASLTKIMTFLVTLFFVHKYEINLKTQIQISKQTSLLTGTSAQLLYGDYIKLNDLLYAMMLPSGNDASQAIAQYLGKLIYQKNNNQKKSIQKNDQKNTNLISRTKAINVFISEMNLMARFLGLKRTYFSNCHGLFNYKNISSSNDLAIICRYCIQLTLFKKVVQTKQFECRIFNKFNKINRNVIWYNTNILLQNKECLGIKTGLTYNAGACMSALYNLKGNSVIIVILGCKNINIRFNQTQRLYELIKQLV